MKRSALLLGLAAATPGLAQAQVPTGAALEAPAPSPRPPGAVDAASTAAPDAGPAPDREAPGDQYFMDTAPPASTEQQPEPSEPPPFEPPLPPDPGFEPPPPPNVRHVAPLGSLWLGARVGWFVPFGNAWARARPISNSSNAGYVVEGVPWRDYASSGPVLELNAGLRVARAYTLFALWERAQLRSGTDTSDGKPDGAESDYWAVGIRASSNPDRLAFLTEVAVGYRRARSFYENGVEVQFTDAPFEARLGLGAELRLSRLTSLSSLITVGVGGFGTIERVAPNGNAVPKTQAADQGDGHGWITLTIGGHFDLLPS